MPYQPLPITPNAPSDDDTRKAFMGWFAGSQVIDSDGLPKIVHHGTTAIRILPGSHVAGDQLAAKALQTMAEQHGIAEPSSVPSIFERWLDMGMAQARSVTPEIALQSRLLYEQSKPHITPPTEAIGFDVFRMPKDGKELGVHFGTKIQAQSFGTVFDFYLSMAQPLRLPDLGTWEPPSVMRAANQRGVSMTEKETSAVLSAKDQNGALRKLLMRKGYDGVVYQNEAEGKGDSYIAFSPLQIKQATTQLVALVASAMHEQGAQARAAQALDWLQLQGAKKKTLGHHA